MTRPGPYRGPPDPDRKVDVTGVQDGENHGRTRESPRTERDHETHVTVLFRKGVGLPRSGDIFGAISVSQTTRARTQST